MNNKKLIFIVGAPRSGSTLLLSFLCGIPNTKVLHETKLLKDIYYAQTYTDGLEELASYFDSIEEEIIIEKTSEHCFHLNTINDLRLICKRDIYIVYIVRPPLLTILSLLKASKDSPELFGYIDLQGACEKYEESLIDIYNSLILKSNRYNSQKILEKDSFISSEISIPYSFCVNYRDLTENPLGVIQNLRNCLLINVDVPSLIDNRIANTKKYLPLVITEKHHTNVLRDIQEVEIERRVKISRQIEEGFSDNYIEKSNYIRNYFEHPLIKETVYDLVVNKKILEIETYSLVTIVVPLYNKESYIEETLISLLTQTYQNIRVVVIDDASTDKSLEVVERYFESLPQKLQDKLWIIRCKHNLGVSFTRNIGLAGYADIFSFCDADDVWDKTLVEKSVNTFINYPYVDCVYSRVLHKREELLEKDYSKICNGNVFKDATQYNFLACGSNLFVKSKVIEDNNIEFCTAYKVAEDWDFLIQLSQVALFKCTKEYLITYRRLSDSLSNNKEDQVTMGKTILNKYVIDKKEFSRTFTRLFLYYFSFKNITRENIKDLDYRFIIKTIVNKCKSIVKSYLS